jgi:transposase
VGLQPGLPGGHFVGAPDRFGMAFSARQVSIAGDLLAKAEAVGGAGCLARRLAGAARGARWRGPLAVAGDVPGRQLRSGEKGGSAVGKTKRGKGTKWMVLVDGGGLPLGVRLESASPGEVTLAEATLAEVKVPRPKGRPRQKPKRVIADRAYDSDPLRERLAKRGIELIVPYRENNKLKKYQDGRKLRRYKRRWIVERTNAWLGQFRRLLVRHEHLLSTYRAFFYLACLWITLRRCL